MPKVTPPKEMPVAGATLLVPGALYVVNGKVVLNPISQTATALLASLRASTITTIDVAARSGTFSDTGRPIFDVF
jgi:hypothetical protein